MAEGNNQQNINQRIEELFNDNNLKLSYVDGNGRVNVIKKGDQLGHYFYAIGRITGDIPAKSITEVMSEFVNDEVEKYVKENGINPETDEEYINIAVANILKKMSFGGSYKDFENNESTPQNMNFNFKQQINKYLESEGYNISESRYEEKNKEVIEKIRKRVDSNKNNEITDENLMDSGVLALFDVSIEPSGAKFDPKYKTLSVEEFMNKLPNYYKNNLTQALTQRELKEVGNIEREIRTRIVNDFSVEKMRNIVRDSVEKDIKREDKPNELELKGSESLRTTIDNDELNQEKIGQYINILKDKGLNINLELTHPHNSNVITNNLFINDKETLEATCFFSRLAEVEKGKGVEVDLTKLANDGLNRYIIDSIKSKNEESITRINNQRNQYEKRLNAEITKKINETNVAKYFDQTLSNFDEAKLDEYQTSNLLIDIADREVDLMLKAEAEQDEKKKEEYMKRISRLNEEMVEVVDKTTYNIKDAGDVLTKLHLYEKEKLLKAKKAKEENKEPEPVDINNIIAKASTMELNKDQTTIDNENKYNETKESIQGFKDEYGDDIYNELQDNEVDGGITLKPSTLAKMLDKKYSSFKNKRHTFKGQDKKVLALSEGVVNSYTIMYNNYVKQYGTTPNYTECGQMVAGATAAFFSSDASKKHRRASFLFFRKGATRVAGDIVGSVVNDINNLGENLVVNKESKTRYLHNLSVDFNSKENHLEATKVVSGIKEQENKLNNSMNNENIIQTRVKLDRLQQDAEEQAEKTEIMTTNNLIKRKEALEINEVDYKKKINNYRYHRFLLDEGGVFPSKETQEFNYLNAMQSIVDVNPNDKGNKNNAFFVQALKDIDREVNKRRTYKEKIKSKSKKGKGNTSSVHSRFGD